MIEWWTIRTWTEIVIPSYNILVAHLNTESGWVEKLLIRTGVTSLSILRILCIQLSCWQAISNIIERILIRTCTNSLIPVSNFKLTSWHAEISIIEWLFIRTCICLTSICVCLVYWWNSWFTEIGIIESPLVWASTFFASIYVCFVYITSRHTESVNTIYSIIKCLFERAGAVIGYFL